MNTLPLYCVKITQMIYTLYMDDQEENFVGRLPAKAICQPYNPKLETGIDIGNIFTLATFPSPMDNPASRHLFPSTRTVSAVECAVNSGAYMHWIVARPPVNTPFCCSRYDVSRTNTPLLRRSM